MLGRKIGVGISEEGFCGGDELGIVRANAEGYALVFRGSHGVDVGIIGETGMGVIIENADLIDLLEEAIVNLVDVGAFRRQRRGLREGVRSCARKRPEQRC